jgi:hypothetical protein
MENASGTEKISNVAAMLEAALSSAEKVVEDLNLAHEKKCVASAANGSGSRVHTQANAFNRSSQKRS